VVVASIPSPSVSGFHIGPLFVHAYGLAYVVGIVVAVWVAKRRWAAVGGDPRLVEPVAVWGVAGGLIGARLYFLATSWEEVPPHWWGPLAIWQGGLSIWGGIAGGTLAGLVVLRRRAVDIPAFMDAAAPALLLAQAVGRLGNYFNQELFGGPTSLPWGLEIDAAHRPNGYAQFATFHPTFLYELIWNVALAVALIGLGRSRRIRPPGIFALYVAGYSFFRIFEELLRIDPSHHVAGLRLNFFIAASLFVVGLVWFVRTQRPPASRPGRRGGPVALGAAWLCLCAGCGHAGPGPGASGASGGEAGVVAVAYRSAGSLQVMPPTPCAIDCTFAANAPR
jgi:prolipoprotein diacylglyceryl transferase